LLAWVGLGADGLSSSCYGPEEAFKALGSHIHLGVFLALATAVTVFIIALGYNQVSSCSRPGAAAIVRRRRCSASTRDWFRDHWRAAPMRLLEQTPIKLYHSRKIICAFGRFEDVGAGLERPHQARDGSLGDLA
jgi:hypothetical protein